VLRGKVDPEKAKKIVVQGHWIWGDSAKDGALPPAGEIITLRKTFKLDTEPVSAGAVITCDNGYTLFVNNRKVSESDDWTKPAAVALHTALRKGPNNILVIAKNAGKGPNAAGLFFEVRIRDEKREETIIASDYTWEWTAKVPNHKEGRLGAFDPKSWARVTTVREILAWKNVLFSDGAAMLAGTAANGSMIRASLMKSDFLMRTLGRPNRDQIVTERPNELSTLEAIDLANGSLLAQNLEKGAKRLLAAQRPDLVTELYRHALSRNPSEAEKALASEILGPKPTQQGIEDLLWSVCMLPEFQVVR
jgi:hypothetical protein